MVLKMAAVRHLGFVKFEFFLTVGAVKRPILHQRTKFRKDRSNRCRYIAIFVIFKNPRWRTAAILKGVKSPYLCNRLTDFDEIWHDDAHCRLQRIDRKNFEFLKIQDGGSRHLENHKNRDISVAV